MLAGPLFAWAAEIPDRPVIVFTNARQLIVLGPEGPRGTQYWAEIRGVVTYPVPSRGWIYLQDETGGIVATYADRQYRPAAGQWVEVKGFVGRGLFAPFVDRCAVRVLGQTNLPIPKLADPARLKAGEDFGQFVRLRGQVRDVARGWGNLTLLVHDRGQHFQALVLPVPKNLPLPREWLDGEIQIDGIPWAREDAQGKPVDFTLHVALTNFITILQPGSSNLFDRPLRAIKSLAEPSASLGARVKVSGVVTLHQPSGYLFLQDDSGPIEARLLPVLFKGDPNGSYVDHPPQTLLAPGEVIELIGAPWGTPPVLMDAEFRKLGPGPAPQPVRAPLADVLAGRQDAQLVTLTGRLIDRTSRATGSQKMETFTLASGDQLFEARWETEAGHEWPWDENSYLQVTGIAAGSTSDSRRKRSSHLLLRSAADVQAVAPPGWWQRPEVLRTFGIAGAIALLAVGVIFLLRRQVIERTAALVCANGQLQHEIAERTRAEERLAEALNTERDLHRLKTRFVSMVSHEFRTPLGNIQSSAELLADYFERLPVDRRSQLLRNIVHGTRDMAAMMEEVLLLSRLESAQGQCHPEWVQIVEFCQSLVDELESATRTRCPIQLVTAGMAERAWGDPGLLRHVLSNLLSNAVKYSAPGSPIVFHVRQHDREAIFEIRDHGIGIPDTDRQHLFREFYRGSNVADTPGTGLGLVIVKRCVEFHRGTIELQSEVGAGTAVTVRLPLFAKESETALLRRGAAPLPVNV